MTAAEFLQSVLSCQPSMPRPYDALNGKTVKFMCPVAYYAGTVNIGIIKDLCCNGDFDYAEITVIFPNCGTFIVKEKLNKLILN